MNNSQRYEDIQKQSYFCLTLMQALNEDIQGAKCQRYCFPMEKHTQKKNDVIRLRRELNKLRELLDW